MKKIAILFCFLPFFICFSNEPKQICTASEAREAVVKRVNKVYGVNYLIQPIKVRSDGKFWDVCSKRTISPSKIVHVKVNKSSKICDIKAITHYEDSVVVNTTGNTQLFLAMKKEIECNSDSGATNLNTIHNSSKTKNGYDACKKSKNCSKR